MLAWARPSLAQDKNASSRRRVQQNHKPPLEISLRREGLAWARRTVAQNNKQPRLRELFNQTTQLHTNSRLGEAYSPKRDDLSPKTKSYRLGEMNEQNSKLSLCNSCLGESGSLE
ncbi:hypothetical protein DEO72_LG8g1820 [Vigna unguiculata]|uniref:Uncharacterized protein n=1 Tax=Vigna unguiculata TaxID=3917 RepID=A0A4D6MQT7_VIGUN|nr:hypothetical protein DEO72_LG8g1820 [Vigna unguiculata]